MYAKAVRRISASHMPQYQPTRAHIHMHTYSHTHTWCFWDMSCTFRGWIIKQIVFSVRPPEMVCNWKVFPLVGGYWILENRVLSLCQLRHHVWVSGTKVTVASSHINTGLIIMGSWCWDMGTLSAEVRGPGDMHLIWWHGYNLYVNDNNSVIIPGISLFVFLYYLYIQ